MIYFHIMTASLSILVCYKWGDWRNWKKYYSTILFFITGDLIYCLLFRDKRLWLYVSELLGHTLINMMMMVTIYPSTIMVFLPHYPGGVFNGVIYVVCWVILYIGTEYVSYSLGYFRYCNGWNIRWSIIFCSVMFPVIYLHHKKPLLAWFISILELIAYIIIFKVDVVHLN